MNKNRKPLAYARVIDKIKLPEEYDKRRVITKADQEEIKKKFKTGKFTYKLLATMYGCSASNIQRIVSKRYREQVAESWTRWRAKNKKKTYDSMEIRKRKVELIKQGIIKL